MSGILRLGSGNVLLPMETGEAEKAVAEVRVLDPELLSRPDTRMLVDIGVQFGAEITEVYGTPLTPQWVSGAYETNAVIMSYHNGGEDGHTSVGPRGSGVPRNVLLIARAVNDAAGHEVYDPTMRAVAFCAAEAHDRYQLCGRALLPEGQGVGRGDERLSAEEVRERYLKAGGKPEVAEALYDSVITTAYNPDAKTQNVDYNAWRANHHDRTLTRVVLLRELIACGDLLGAVSPRGPLIAIEHTVESLCLKRNKQIIQHRLHALGISPHDITGMEHLLEVIGQDEALRSAFADTIAEEPIFLTDHLRYSDEAIRAACGRGIDDLFSGRLENASVLAKYGNALHAGESPRALWEHARGLAGY